MSNDTTNHISTDRVIPFIYVIMPKISYIFQIQIQAHNYTPNIPLFLSSPLFSLPLSFFSQNEWNNNTYGLK